MTEHTEQQAPTPNGREAVQAMVRRDLDERQRVGTERYGTPLQAFNGRDALRDAYEEALDLACYLRQAIAERDERVAAATHFMDADCELWIAKDDGLLWQHPDAEGGFALDYVERRWGPLTPFMQVK